MYKSRLQEMCQQKLYVLPRYTTTKEGPDHNPRFRATVLLGDLSFHTPDPCRSSKEAQSEAARLALDHFAGETLKTSSSGSLNVSITRDISSPMEEDEVSKASDESCTNVSSRSIDFSGTEFPFKNQLQSYAQRRNLNLPSYDSAREGPLHALRHKAKVIVDGQTFESPEFFNSLKEAENAAARVALMSLSKEGNEGEEATFFKNLLQEFAQKECFSLPVYKTVVDGLSHVPSFMSTVEIEGEKFAGECARTKKQAEQNAAKVAWHTMKGRKSSKLGDVLDFNFEVQEDLQIANLRTRPAATNIDLKQCNDTDEDGKRTFPSEIVKTDLSNNTSSANCQYADGGEAFMSDKNLGDGKLEIDCSAASSHVELKTEVSKTSKISTTPSDITFSQLRDPIPLEGSMSQDRSIPISSPSSQSDCSLDHVVADESAKITLTKRSISPSRSPLRKRVMVYPRKPNMELPEGATLLPFSDNTWVAVNVDPSNQK